MSLLTTLLANAEALALLATAAAVATADAGPEHRTKSSAYA